MLRVGENVACEVLTMSAAACHVPVPRILDRLELDGVSAVLLERLPGRAAGQLALESPVRAAATGRACGALHGALAEVAGPRGLRDAPRSDGNERRLLHLDLHPFNVLVDDDGEPTGAIDWANAAVGDPELDRARTWSLLMLDPAARELEDNPGWVALRDHWLHAAGLHALPASARSWACSSPAQAARNSASPFWFRLLTAQAKGARSSV